MNTVKKILFLIGFLLAFLTASAQTDLNIETVFKTYGKQEGSVMIELAKDVLGNHTKINRYKSLIVPSDSATLKATEEAIRKDVKDGKLLMESRKNGQVEAASYCLKKKDKASDYEYILLSNTSKKITLIYVKGNFPPEELERELSQLKRLFIKVNNKRIKI
jgi:hypothetical protein